MLQVKREEEEMIQDSYNGQRIFRFYFVVVHSPRYVLRAHFRTTDH